MTLYLNGKIKWKIVKMTKLNTTTNQNLPQTLTGEILSSIGLIIIRNRKEKNTRRLETTKYLLGQEAGRIIETSLKTFSNQSEYYLETPNMFPL